MKARNPHRATQREAPVALLLVDVINDFAFPESKQLFRFALPAARRISTLKKRLRAQGVPAIYVNDNFGRWQYDFRKQVEHCMSRECLGAPIARLLVPLEEDFFVLKPKLIITGFAADICVLFTANDAYMREYELVVPSDCVASETPRASRNSCLQMERFLRANINLSRHLRI
jgi:nicotinamidase-related amidase